MEPHARSFDREDRVHQMQSLYSFNFWKAFTGLCSNVYGLQCGGYGHVLGMYGYRLAGSQAHAQ